MRFGTDGVRGLANAELTPELTLRIGRAAGAVLGGERFLVGRDTRRSGAMLEAALAAGVCSTGADVELLGELPTPALATIAALDGCAGAMISASHNPFADNGIKLFAPGGRKLSDHLQGRIEAVMDELQAGGGESPSVRRPTGSGVGVISHAEGRATARYEDVLVAALEGRRLEGLRVVLDCGHGAASDIAGEVFARCGADTMVIGDVPDGLNINEGVGSTDTALLRTAVRAAGADVGFAFDGDADRVIAVDGTGAEIDGDHLIVLCAVDLRERGRLRNDAVAVTVMSNLGLHRAMTGAGIEVVTTAVGDRYLLEAIDARGLSLGGEQSGHIIFSDVATTGDGLLSALVVSDLLVRSGRSMGELAASAMTRFPQVLLNVAVERRSPEILEAITAEVEAVEAELGAEGRVLVRPSGTEPIVRVMVEAGTAEAARVAAERLALAVRSAAG